jgi:hypothetical protein
MFLIQWNRCYTILSDGFSIEKKTFNDSRYLLFHAPAYHVSYEDFIESLPKAEYTWIKSKVNLGHREHNEMERGDPKTNGLLRSSQ